MRMKLGVPIRSELYELYCNSIFKIMSDRNGRGAIWVTVKSMYAIGGFIASVHVHAIGEGVKYFPFSCLRTL